MEERGVFGEWQKNVVSPEVRFMGERQPLSRLPLSSPLGGTPEILLPVSSPPVQGTTFIRDCMVALLAWLKESWAPNGGPPKPSEGFELDPGGRKRFISLGRTVI